MGVGSGRASGGPLLGSSSSSAEVSGSGVVTTAESTVSPGACKQNQCQESPPLASVKTTGDSSTDNPIYGCQVNFIVLT